ncbi:serine hydrolase domain-containing protein [Allokutzneria oryzae]|uniref:Serine hydrolase domain-containing protein n=1 Tax=Allokutzneria oryzae TaxID=1378989 RepID=A0ABV5ZS99_9PSEU
MTKKIGLLALALAALVALASLTASAGATTLPGGALKAGLDRMVATRAATAALARLDDGPAHWSGAAGVRELSSPARPRADGHFRIGSVTKTFVATVLLQLADEGRLGLDDPIARHLPGTVPNGERITVRQLLNHTSGLYDYMHDPGYSTNRWRGDARFRSYRPQELLAVAFSHPPVFPHPGSAWKYSNTNYIVAGLLIERLTGRDYGTEIRDRILRPLGLAHTTVPGDHPGVAEPHAHGYTWIDGGPVDATAMNPSLDWAAGEMVSTSADLNRFLAALLAGRLTSAAGLAAMKQTVPTGTDFQYGLGLQRFDLPCGARVFGHGGELIGFLTYATGSAGGRQLTLSYNPHSRPAPAETVIGLFNSAYCQADPTRHEKR